VTDSAIHPLNERLVARSHHRQGIPTVVTLMEEKMRWSVDVATECACVTYHAQTATDALEAARHHRSHTVLISPAVLPHPELCELVTRISALPGLLPVAVIGESAPKPYKVLLTLRALGVHNILDLSTRAGWKKLRTIVTDPTTQAADAILQAVTSAFAENEMNRTRVFFNVLVRGAPNLTSVKSLGLVLAIDPSALLNRFYRRQLPSPWTYLTATRLLFAASCFERPGVSIADVASQLNYSSVQSFGRHVKQRVGLTPREYRYRFSFKKALDRYVGSLVLPYQEHLRDFDPWGSIGGGAAEHHTS
jgi:AraC-like DNA-binding protein